MGQLVVSVVYVGVYGSTSSKYCVCNVYGVN